MKKSVIAIHVCVLIWIVGCKREPILVERVSVTPEMLTDSVFTNRALSFFTTENHIILQDFDREGAFIKIYNQSGRFEEEVGRIGQGPGEFVTPSSIQYGANAIFTRDLNSNRASIVNLTRSDGDNFASRFVSCPFIESNIVDLTSDMSDNFIVYNPESDSIITVFNPNGKIITSFGKLPFLSSITNKRSAYFGRIFYNSFTKKLVLSLGSIPYTAVYEFDGIKGKLLCEKQFAEFDHRLSNGELILEERGKNCLVGCTLTKNYIVCIENDPDYTGTDHSRTSPKRYTIGLYDYNLNLRKIVNLNMVRNELTSSGKDDVLYVLAQNPEFCIVKVEL